MSDKDDQNEQRFHFSPQQCESPRPGPPGVLCALDKGHGGTRHEIPLYQIAWAK